MFDSEGINLALNVIMLVSLVGGGIFAAKRSGNASAVNEWRQEAEAIRTRADRLHDELDDTLKQNREMQGQNREMQGQISKLESLPDMTLLLTEFSEQRKGAEAQTVQSMKVVSDMFENHETRAEERHRATLESFKQLNSGLAAVNESLMQMSGHEGRKDGR